MRDKSGVNVKKILLSVMVLLALGTAAPVTAAPITGVLTLVGSVIVSATSIDWVPVVGPPSGTFSTVTPGNGYFTGIVGPPATPTTGESMDLGSGGGVNPPVPGFLHGFTGPGMNPEFTDLSYNLDYIIPPSSPNGTCGTGTYAAGQTCVLGVFLLTQGETGVAVKLEVFGHFVDITYGDPGTMNSAVGAYTTQLNTPELDTIAEIVARIDSGGTIENGYSATFNANAVPEPATLLTFGLGTAALAAHRRRKAKKESKG